MTAALDVHPLALAIPEMMRDEYVELVNDIKANGVKVPIVTYQSKILDDRHRAGACAELGITPDTIEVTGAEPEALAFVISGT
jgi:ParB-like chromosome segregation protein Spo0J